MANGDQESVPADKGPGLASPADVLAALRPWLEDHRRNAWKPVVADGEPSATVSKFGGVSWLHADEPQPVCGQCGEDLQLFVQLELSQLPPAAADFGDGVLQLYYCAGRASFCIGEGGWEPFTSDVSLVRIVPREDLTARADPPGTLAHFPPRSIVQWIEFHDHPDFEEHPALGLVHRFDFATRTITYEWAGHDVALSVSDVEDQTIFEAMMPDHHDKLGGWPHWVQGAEYPSCPRCTSRMRLVFQVASEDNLPFMFGDGGIGHITQCPTHLDIVAFGWACS